MFYSHFDKLFLSSDALKCLNLRLVGAFDVLRGRHRRLAKNRKGKKPNFLLHYRYFYDPPEFQTVIATVDDVDDEDSQFHLGYYRWEGGV